VASVKKIARILLIIVLITTIGVSGFKLCEISCQYTNEAKVKNKMMQYHPQMPETPEDGGWAEKSSGAAAGILLGNTEDTSSPQPDKKYVNQSIIDMQSNINKEVVGWITIPDTRIDYPIVAAEDNDYYLRRDIYGNSANAGSIFMDYRCASDFSDFNSIIYGHNMKNRSMFGDLREFADSNFFNEHPTGMLFAEEGTYVLKIFAFMVVRDDDFTIYDPAANPDALFRYVEKHNRNYRAPDTSRNIITLSTCAYDYNGARMVLLASLIPAEEMPPL